jgi:hypothetical protein
MQPVLTLCVLCGVRSCYYWLQVMVCQPSELKPFADFAIWGDDAGPEHVWDDDSRMFLPKQYHAGFVARLEEFVCGHTTEVCDYARFTLLRQ